DPAPGSWEEPMQPRGVAGESSGATPAHPSGIRDQGIVGKLIEWEKEERENAPTVPFKPGEHGSES
ncbi:MAG: hypothetical protein QGG40_15640, partial [Myxococcota bacterium]|nr:hypothetical protein [Myxococcota bacterium]